MNRGNRSLEEADILVYAIALRYWELDGIVKTDSRQLLSRIQWKGSSIGDKLVDVAKVHDNIRHLHTLLDYLLSTTEKQDHSLVMQKFSLSIKGDKELHDAFRMAMDRKREPREIADTCASYIRYINIYYKKLDFVDEMRKKLSNVIYGETQFNLSEVTQELITTLNQYRADSEDDSKRGMNNPFITGGFRTDDESSMAEAWTQTLESGNPDAILKTGYQGINRGLGKGGLFRGDTIVVGALQHKYKSGMMNDFVCDIAYYNKPYMFDPDKKPVIIKISLENHIADDLTRMYKRIIAVKEHRIPTDEEMLNTTPEQAANVINEHMGKNGYKFVHVRINPSDVGYLDIQKFVTEIMNEGYEVHLLVIDYLIKLSTKGIPPRRDGTDYQEMYSQMRNYCSERNITFITPHQLSTEATYLIRDDIGSDFVKHVAGNSYYAKCKQVDREVDIEMVQHLVTRKEAGELATYYTWCIGKNRRVHDTPESHKSFAMKFTELGLMPDVETEPKFMDLSKLKQVSIGMSGEEEDWL